MCGSMVDIQSLTAEIKKVKVKASHTRYRALGPELIPVYRQSRIHSTCGNIVETVQDRDVVTSTLQLKLECGPMPNVMVALPNIGGALCSTPQSLADAHY